MFNAGFKWAYKEYADKGKSSIKLLTLKSLLPGLWKMLQYICHVTIYAYRIL